MNTTTRPTRPATDIETQILAILDNHPDELKPWAAIRSQLSGTNWQRAEALVSLETARQIHAVKVAGRTYVMALS